MAEVFEVNDIDELAGHRLAAATLLDATPHASFFHTIDWLRAYWRHYGEGQKLRALVVRAAGQTIGVVPLVVRTRASRLGPLRVLTYPPRPRDGGCWYGPIGGNQAATLTMAIRHLESTPRDWDLVDLPWTDHQGADHGRTQRAMQRAGWRASATVHGAASHIDLSGGYQAYLATRGQEFRRGLRHTRQRVAALGRVEFLRHRPAPLCHGDGDPRWDLFGACQSLASEDASPPTARSDFLSDAHAAASTQGAVDLCVLTLNGRPVACAYNYHHNGRVFVLWSGSGAATSAGAEIREALFHSMIEDGCRRGDRLIELGTADSILNRRLRTGSDSVWRLRHASLRSLRANAAVLRHQLTQGWLPRVG